MYNGIRLSIEELREKRFAKKMEKKERKSIKSKTNVEVPKPPDINRSY